MSDQPTFAEHVACLLCGANDPKPAHRGPDYFLRRPGDFQLVECCVCRLLYQNPRPDLQSIDQYYPESYGSYGSAQRGLAGVHGLAGILMRRAQYSRCMLIDRLVPPGHTQRRVLDIGCASGIFLEAMQRWTDWQVEGVELHEPTATATSTRLAVPVFAGPFEAAQYPDHSFDAVSMWDVLEHLHDPLMSLREIARILRPGGILFVRVPNAQSYVARLSGRYWSGYDLPRHMSVFTPATLTNMLRTAGFSAPEHTFWSASYLSAVHSLQFALDDWKIHQAATIRRILLHPILRAAAYLPFQIADRLAGGAAIEVVVRLHSQNGMA